jgi:hypothetical protein
VVSRHFDDLDAALESYTVKDRGEGLRRPELNRVFVSCVPRRFSEPSDDVSGRSTRTTASTMPHFAHTTRGRRWTRGAISFTNCAGRLVRERGFERRFGFLTWNYYVKTMSCTGTLLRARHVA